MRIRLWRAPEEPGPRIQELCCEEDRQLDGWGEDDGLDPMREAEALARLQCACERLDQRRSNPPRSPL